MGLLPEAEILRGELVNRRATHQLHATLKFAAHQFQRAFDTRLTGCGKREEIVPPKPDRFRAERQGLEHVCSALYAAVHHDIDPVADGIDDLG